MRASLAMRTNLLSQALSKQVEKGESWLWIEVKSEVSGRKKAVYRDGHQRRSTMWDDITLLDSLEW